ncbi:hypothetical protein K32_47170 [Kaistia sp. 32K]|uniref:hypothetical protein n=1 Tax=Kaistia sp. 32K TaxID=2795690 RepID=UPI00191665C0|nr:hypothetical protein [Kaistia sp. 32K]BCP56100.1 hypothetical protein K32_47170 [Kaistia sp. 32K]
MNKTIYVAAAAIFSLSGIAARADGPVVSRVTNVNWTTGALTLQSGESFQFQPASRLYGVIPGQMVGITHDGENGVSAYKPYYGRMSNDRPR